MFQASWCAEEPKRGAPRAWPVIFEECSQFWDVARVVLKQEYFSVAYCYAFGQIDF